MTEVLLRAREPDRLLRLADCRWPDEYVGSFRVDMAGDGLTASLSVSHLAFDGDLPGFLRGLAADYAGWPGERRWMSPDRDLAVLATHGVGGHVRLRWSLRRIGFSGAVLWCAEVAFEVEAGEEMAGLADEVATFLAPPTG